jgi:hypothetical protein
VVDTFMTGIQSRLRISALAATPTPTHDGSDDGNRESLCTQYFLRLPPALAPLAN